MLLKHSPSALRSVASVLQSPPLLSVSITCVNVASGLRSPLLLLVSVTCVNVASVLRSPLLLLVSVTCLKLIFLSSSLLNSYHW